MSGYGYRPPRRHRPPPLRRTLTRGTLVARTHVLTSIADAHLNNRIASLMTLCLGPWKILTSPCCPFSARVAGLRVRFWLPPLPLLPRTLPFLPPILPLLPRSGNGKHGKCP